MQINIPPHPITSSPGAVGVTKAARSITPEQKVKDFKNMLSEVGTTTTTGQNKYSAKASDIYDWIAKESIENPDWADRAAFLYGCEYSETPPLYIGDWPIIRIAATGEIFTPEKQEFFKQISDLYHGGRVKIYKEELARGTPPLDIIKKIFDYNATMPEDFRKMSGWS